MHQKRLGTTALEKKQEVFLFSEWEDYCEMKTWQLWN